MASCEHCTQGYEMKGEPVGSIVDGAYLSPAPPSEANTAEPRAIILLTDIFGLALKNSKLLADEFAKRVGCDVWVPDLFAPGQPPLTVDELEPLMPDRVGEKMPFINKLRFVLLALTRLFSFYAVRPAVVDPRTTTFVEKIKKEKGYTRVGAVGYCFGGAIAIRLASTDVFNTVVIAHPGNCTIAQIKAIKVPASWACAEDDMSFKKPLRDEAEAIFAARKGKPDFVDYEFRDHKGTVHGFAARPNFALPEVVEAFQAALDQTAEWFKKTL